MHKPPGGFGSWIGERCGRGLFGGLFQQEATMNVNYDPATDNAQQPGAGKPATEARQGVISGRVVLVLVVSMLLAIAAMAIGYAVAWR
jgi:hypothetical protein